MTGKGSHVAFEIQWSARAAPIDPSPQAVPDSQSVMSSVLIKLNQPSNPKLISVDEGPNAARKRARDTMALLNNKTQKSTYPVGIP